MDERLPEQSEVIFDPTSNQATQSGTRPGVLQQPVEPPPQAPPAVSSQPISSIGEPHFKEQSYPGRQPGGSGTVIKALLGLFALLVLIIGGWKLLPLLFPKPTEIVTLTYWGLSEDEAVMKNTLDEFHRLNPSIVVKYVKQDPNQYRERLLARMNNGTGPDIFRFHNTWTGMLTSVLLPLSNDVISPTNFEKAYYPVMTRDMVRNGAILGIPMNIDTLALFTNTDILKAAGADVPATWVDFTNTATRLTVKDEEKKIKTSGAALGTADNITHVEDIVSLLFAQNGVLITKIGSAPQQAKEALEFFTSFARGENSVWDPTLDPSNLAFAKGNLAMYLGYYSDFFTIKSTNASLPFEVHPVPRLPGRMTTIASYWAEGASSKTIHPKEALIFLKYLTEKEVLKKLYSDEVGLKLFGQLYPRKDMADELKSDPLLSPFVGQAGDAVSTPFASDTNDSGLNAELNGYLKNAIRASQNSVTDDILQQLIEGENQAIGKYGL